MKKCSKCGVQKSAEYFHKDTRAKSGLQSQCKGCRRAALSQYYEGNREAIRRKQRACDKERRAEINRKSRLKHLDARSEYSQKYYRENKDKHRERQRRRRARKLSGVGMVPEGYESTLWEIQQGKCFYCEADLRKTGVHEDHKIPLVHGGRHTKSNLCLACPECNLRKHTKTAPEFLRILSSE